MLKKISLSLIFCAAAVLLGCDGGGYKTSPGGLKYVILKDSAGPVGEVGGFVMFDMLMKTSKDSVIQNSFETGQPIPVEIFKPTYKGCIYEAFQLLSEGDSARFVVQADSFFLRTIGESKVPEKIDPADQLTFTIKVRKMYNKAFVEEERKKVEESNQQRMEHMMEQFKTDSALIEDYLAKNKIKAQRTPQGVYLEFKKTNKQGINLIKGDSVEVFYAGRLLGSSEEFDNSRGTPFPVVVGYSQLIPGWHEALLHMKKGEKAVVYIPSPLAYGDQGNRGIPPNAVLVFDLEVLDKK